MSPLMKGRTRLMAAVRRSDRAVGGLKSINGEAGRRSSSAAAVGTKGDGDGDGDCIVFAVMDWGWAGTRVVTVDVVDEWAGPTDGWEMARRVSE